MSRATARRGGSTCPTRSIRWSSITALSPANTPTGTTIGARWSIRATACCGSFRNAGDRLPPEASRRRDRRPDATSPTPYAGPMTPAPPTVRRTAPWPVLTGVAVLAGVTAAAIGALSLAAALTATGLPDPGPVTTVGLPFVRAAGEVAAVVAVGSFLFAAFLVPPQDNGVLDVDGYRALRVGTVAAGA